MSGDACRGGSRASSRSCGGRVRPWGTAARAARKASALLVSRGGRATRTYPGGPPTHTGPPGYSGFGHGSYDLERRPDRSGISRGQTALGVLMRRLAVLSLHTSPLVQPGAGDSGGMYVYVRELVSSLAQAGVTSDVYVRRWAEGLPDVVEVEPGFRVPPVPAGPVDLPKDALPEVVDLFAEGVLARLTDDVGAAADVLHANYWLSAVAGHRLKHELDLPLVSTFHTLARVKAETGDLEPQRRGGREAEVVGCSDAILANSAAEAAQLERLYGADPARIEIV